MMIMIMKTSGSQVDSPVALVAVFATARCDQIMWRDVDGTFV